MREMTDVLDAIEALHRWGERMAGATIVAVRGSTYRRPAGGRGAPAGCNGAIEVFVEPAERAAEMATTLVTALEEEHPASLITVLGSTLRGRGGGSLSARALSAPKGPIHEGLELTGSRR
ncbi:MAG: hypothetical protein ACRDIF_05755 [Actinomycetota bacterium]